MRIQACRALLSAGKQWRKRRQTSALLIAVLLPCATAAAQALPAVSLDAAQTPPQTGTPAPETITLQDALERARKNSPHFLSAMTELNVAREDRVLARASLLPSLNYTVGMLYTQGNGTPSGRYVANNGVHEYLSLGSAHQSVDLGGGQVAAYRRSVAGEALARARSEIAARGLVVTVVQSYYGLVVAQRKYGTAQQAGTEAQRFLNISQDLEQGGEVAHSDVIKAQLQYNDRQRDLREAELALEKARLALAVLIFPNFNQNFTVVDDLRLPEPLPAFPEVQQLAMKQNPDLRAAAAALQMADMDVAAARSAHFPSIAVDYFYGIDALQFATRGPDGLRNLGYSASATLTLPIWSWGATQSKLKQAGYRRQQARVELSAAQRQLLANLNSFYREAEVARSQLDTLRASADLAAQSLRLTTLRYQSGEATVLEVVDAQNTLTLARNGYDDAESRYRLAVATLQTITGAF